MEFRILGPVEVTDGGKQVPLGGRQQVKLLAALLLAADRTVPSGVLVDRLWDGDPPATARQQIHKIVATLRRRIPGRIETTGVGYRIRTAGAWFDAAEFSRLTSDGTDTTLTQAVALWRGTALAGLDGRELRAAAAGWDELRLSATEKLMKRRLAAGEAAGVAAELPALVASAPLRESLLALYMRALHRSGRTADALACFASLRRRLADELGADPGPELARLHEQLLRGELGIDGADVPRTLPYDLPDFSGRHADMNNLFATAAVAPIVAIDGMAGVGKTALVVHLAHRLADRFPDGQLYCDLRGHTPEAEPLSPQVALELLLRMVGVPDQQIPDGPDARSARWRSTLAGRRILVVLDNAASAGQVRAMLPAGAECLTIVTSRARLGELEGACLYSLDVMDRPEALALLDRVGGCWKSRRGTRGRRRRDRAVRPTTARHQAGRQPAGPTPAVDGGGTVGQIARRVRPAFAVGSTRPRRRRCLRAVLRAPLGRCAARVPAAGPAPRCRLRCLRRRGDDPAAGRRCRASVGRPGRRPSAAAADRRPLHVPRSAAPLRPTAGGLRSTRDRSRAGKPTPRLLLGGRDRRQRPDQSRGQALRTGAAIPAA